MSGGYTPVFSSAFDGTLGGRWPDSGVWLCLLALADWRGHIDMTPNAIAARIGIPVEQLRECLARFCAPDPESRSKAEEGRRLIPIDPERSWGWRIVNFEAYRKRARDASDVAEGRAAERARRYRGRHAPSRAVTSGHDDARDITRRHAPSRHSDSDIDSDSDKNKNPPTPLSGGDDCESEDGTAQPEGLDLAAWMRWLEYRRQIKRPLKQASIPAAQQKLAAFGDDQAAVVEQSIANGWQGLFALKDAPRGPRSCPPERLPPDAFEVARRRDADAR